MRRIPSLSLAVVATTTAVAVSVMQSCASSVVVDPNWVARFPPLPPSFHEGIPPDAALIDLGRMLYYEPRLSADGTVSCNSCHPLDRMGVDGERFSPGIGGARGGRNAPTSYLAAGHLAQFWDGRAPTVEEQAKGPILNPIEMGMHDGEEVVARLGAIDGYPQAFASAFPEVDEPLQFDHVAAAIGAFERGLVTPARWDAYARGDQSALSELEKRGFNTFLRTGCHACHSGSLFGGRRYRKLGLREPWPGLEDPGRGAVLDRPRFNGWFKVPSLRNVVRTAPYLHDGSVDHIERMVQLMARHQLARELSARDLTELVAFLGALEGRPDPEYVAPPALP